jgi:hypothetical protein
LPPRPKITPLFINSTPPGKEPLTVHAGVPVEVEKIVTPELIVQTNLEDWFHPAAIAALLKLKLLVSAVTEKLNWLDLP